MTTAVYARVSTDEQAKSGYGLSAQIRQCRAKARTHDVIEYVDEGVSGQFLDRPAMNKLRQDLKNGLIDKVVCLAPDRLARDSTNASIILKEILFRSKIEFVNTNFEDSAIGMFNFQILAAVAELEKATINERMTRGRREKARQGKIVSPYKIYGYDFDKETSQLVVNEDEATTVRFIFDSFTNGMGINGVAKRLNELNVPTKKGVGVWHKETVRQILHQTAYAGTFYHNKWNTEGMLGNKYRQDDDKVPVRIRDKSEWIPVPCPVIVEQRQWDYAQRLLEDARRRFNNMGRNHYLLSGMIRCGDCGNTMTGRKAKNWGKYVFQYTDIKNQTGARNRGCGVTVPRDDIEEQVWQTVHGWIESYSATGELAATAEASPSFEQTELELVERQLADIKKKRTRFVKMLASADDELGIEDEINEQLRELTKQERQLLDRQSKLEQAKTVQLDSEQRNASLQEVVEYLSAHDVLGFDDKQWIVRKLVREVRVFKNGDVQIHTF